MLYGLYQAGSQSYKTWPRVTERGKQLYKFLTYQIYPQTQNMSQEVIFKKNCPPCINTAESYKIPLAIPVFKLKFLKYNTSTQSYVKFSI